jgi:hypothetical protein
MLLLDLDGVVVFEAEAPWVPAKELILLHENLGRELDKLGMPIAVLTHRSRREARQILETAGLDGMAALAGVIAAEDLFLAGIRQVRGRMLSRGLRKDLVLPILERRFLVKRSNVAVIDDRADNLQDLLAAGLGLAIHAPSYLLKDRLISFDVEDALSAIRNWTPNKHQSKIISLPPREILTSSWLRTGVNTSAHGRHVFNIARRAGNFLRLTLRVRPQSPDS